MQAQFSQWHINLKNKYWQSSVPSSRKLEQSANYGEYDSADDALWIWTKPYICNV